jgi:hypothetical protein
MKTIQSLLLVAAVELPFLVGKYAAVYRGLGTHCEEGLPYNWVKENGLFERFVAAVITLGELRFTVRRQSGSAVRFQLQMPKKNYSYRSPAA